MTVIEQRVLDCIEEYGIKRRCKCYQLNCLILPYPLHKIMIQKIIREVKISHGSGKEAQVEKMAHNSGGG